MGFLKGQTTGTDTFINCTPHGDNVIIQRNFWNKTVNQYLNYPDHDVTYLEKLLVTAAYWEGRYNEYLAHLKVTNTSYHLA